MRTVLAICLLTLAVAGCGAAGGDSAEDFEGEKQQVAATVEGIEEAALADEPGKVCEALLSGALLATLKKQGTNCETAVSDAFDDADSFDLAVEDVEIDGDKATAKVASGRGDSKKTDTLDLVRDESAWKIASLQAAS
ncbi:MAG: nuclear transport factor 2 family protein [Solirubrobacteraceae bacterium]